MNDVTAYVGALVEGQLSEITLSDPDLQGNLDQYMPVILFKWPEKNWQKEWKVIHTDAIPTIVKLPSGLEVRHVNTLVLQVIPELPPPGCLGQFLLAFQSLLKKSGPIKDPTGTGTLSGTLNPTAPPPPPPPMAVGGGAVAPVRGPRKMRDVDKPLIFYGTKPS